MLSRRGAPERFLTSVLMTDIVGSTEHAAELGDSAWRELVQLHHAVVRAALRRHGGREIDTSGDGFFATFDAPAEALDCALELVDEVKALGLEIRAGVHVGEVEQIGRKVGGISVPIAARIMSAAQPGEVLASSTVRDLAAGARLRFEDRGVQNLKGVPGEWQLYAVRRAGQERGEQARPLTADVAVSRRAAAVRRAHSRPIWQRRPRLAALLVLGLATVLVAGGLLIIKPWQTPALPGIDEDGVGLIEAGRGEIVASIKVGARPGGIAVADGQVWVTNTGSNTVVRIDPATRAVTREIDVGKAPLGVVIAEGSVWVANSGERTVTRINVATSRVVDTITVGNAPTALAAGGGSVWAANTGDSTVMRIDGASGAVGAPIPVAAGPIALALDDTGLWVASADGAVVVRLDPVTGVTSVAPIPLPSRASALAIAGGAVWVATADGTVSRIDTTTNRITATIDLGGAVSAAAATKNAIWFADPEGRIRRIDPANPQAPASSIATSSAPQSLAAGVQDELWVVARAAPGSHRGGTLRVVGLIAPDLDPAGFPHNVTMLEADGLVGFRRVGGIAGSVLLPDLATAIPRPTNGGRTYTFQLRDGLKYSTGQPVVPADFRRAIERDFQVADGPGTVGNLYYTGISGAEKCANPEAQPVERCDLSAGIITDDAANTVTFQLAEPDPDFLYKLAITAAYPVPDGVPMNAAIEGVFPGTGPYTLSSQTESDFRLTRNPNFTPWDVDVRPDGYPDEIVFSIGLEAEERIRLVQAGEADFMALRGDNRVSADLVRQLRTEDPAQLHGGSVTFFSAFMNTTRPPFDSLEARQAVSMAIDRARVGEIFGGIPAAAPTCQILPPGWPGYQPYCPYTVAPDPGGLWHGPDLDAARLLVDTSGTRGAPVVVGPTRAPYAAMRDYLSTVLSDLGYEATVDERTDNDAFFAAMGSGEYQISIANILAGIAAPSDFFFSFTCAAGDPTIPCDPAFDALFEEARGLQTSDAPAAAAKWAELDRYITDRAYYAPLINEGSDFVSSRVGNYQFHPAYLFLWDQAWVQ